MSLHELVVNSSKTCDQWRVVIAQYVLEPKIWSLANSNGAFKTDIVQDGWTENHNDTDLIFHLYGKYEYYSRKYLLFYTSTLQIAVINLSAFASALECTNNIFLCVH